MKTSRDSNLSRTLRFPPLSAKPTSDLSECLTKVKPATLRGAPGENTGCGNMGTMSTDYLLMTASPLGLDDSAAAFAEISPDSLLRTDNTNTMAVLVHQLDEQPILWITPSRLITDWNEVTRLLPENSRPPSQHLVYWTELHGPSSAPKTAERIALSLARIMDGWAAPFSGEQQ